MNVDAKRLAPAWLATQLVRSQTDIWRYGLTPVIVTDLVYRISEPVIRAETCSIQKIELVHRLRKLVWFTNSFNYTSGVTQKRHLKKKQIRAQSATTAEDWLNDADWLPCSGSN